MITAKHQEHLLETIQGLSEIELDELLKEIGQHLHKNNLEHLIDAAFQMDDQTGMIEDLENDLSEIRRVCRTTAEVKKDDTDAFDRMRLAITEIQEITESYL